MSKSDVDRAYELLVVIIGLNFSIMGSNPEFFWSDRPDMPLELTAMRQTVIPLLVLTGVWLIGYLVTNENHRIHVKLAAWALAVFMAMVHTMIYFEGAEYWGGISHQQEPYIAFPLVLLLIPLLVFRFIVPRYEEMYPDATFFRTKTRLRLLLTYLLYQVILWFSLIMSDSLYRVL